MRFRGIIFDCDGVLIMNTNEVYDEALISAVQTFKPGISDKEIYKLISKTRGKTFIYQLEKLLGSENPFLNDAIEHYEQYIHLDENYHRISLLEGAENVLTELKHRGYMLGMATGMNPSLLARLFQDGILPDIFDQVARVHDISNPRLQKPHPKTLLDVLDSLGISPAEAVYIGDTKDDVEMARRCGAFSVAVLTGRLRKDQAIAVGADLVLASVLELEEWF